jgi:hypothetical protein
MVSSLPFYCLLFGKLFVSFSCGGMEDVPHQTFRKYKEKKGISQDKCLFFDD